MPRKSGVWYIVQFYATDTEHVHIFPEFNLNPSKHCSFKTGLTTLASSRLSNGKYLM